MALVTSKSTTWPSATAPSVESTGPSIAGCVFAVMVSSFQLQFVIEWMRPPATLWEFAAVETLSRSRADVTWRAPTPLTRRRTNVCFTGLASTSRMVLVPYLVVGAAAFTSASASTVPTTANGGGQVQSAWHAPGQRTLSVPSHCSLAWFTSLSPQTGAGAQVQSDWQRPGQALSAVPSHSSLTWFTTLSPQTGAGAQLQSVRQRPGHALSAVPSHCSLAWFT